MESLYSIQEELLKLFADIEESGGEITEEQSEQLKITKEALYNKLGNYHKAVSTWNGDIDTINAEIARLNARKKVLTNRTERLKNTMLNAVIEFGNTAKLGNKVIELPTARLSTRNNKSILLDDIRINELVRLIIQYCIESYPIYLDNNENIDDVTPDIETILEIINNRYLCNKEYDSQEIAINNSPEVIINNNDIDNTEISNFELFTIDDLKCITVTLSYDTTLFDMIANPALFDKAYIEAEEEAKLIVSTIKESYKNAIDSGKLITVAKNIINQSLLIK